MFKKSIIFPSKITMILDVWFGMERGWVVLVMESRPFPTRSWQSAEFTPLISDTK